MYNVCMLSENLIPFSVADVITSVPVSIFWIVFLVFIVLATIISYILIFHWNEYKVHGQMISKIQIVYIIGLIVLVIGAGLSLLMYSYSI